MISFDLEERVRCHTRHWKRDWERDSTMHVNAEGADEMLWALDCRGPYGSREMRLEIARAQDRIAASIRDRYRVADEVRAELEKLKGHDRG